MRSLFLRLVVAVVVGSLWGAVVAPTRASSSTDGHQQPAGMDAVHHLAQSRMLTALGDPRVNPLRL